MYLRKILGLNKKSYPCWLFCDVKSFRNIFNQWKIIWQNILFLYLYQKNNIRHLTHLYLGWYDIFDGLSEKSEIQKTINGGYKWKYKISIASSSLIYSFSFWLWYPYKHHKIKPNQTYFFLIVFLSCLYTG